MGRGNPQENWNLKTRIAILFLDTYPPKSFRYLQGIKTYDSKPFDLKRWTSFLNITVIDKKNTPNKKNIICSVKMLMALTTFFGLPNKLPPNEQDITKRRIFLNFSGWPSSQDKHTSFARKRCTQIFSIIPLISIYHLIRMFTKTFTNIAKLVTEFLPGLIGILAIAGREALENKNGDKLILWEKVISIILFLVYHLTRFLTGVGRLVTSPCRNAQIWYYVGQKDNLDFFHPDILLAITSISISSFLYLAIIPTLIINAPQSIFDLLDSGTAASLIQVSDFILTQFLVILILSSIGISIVALASSIIKPQCKRTPTAQLLNSNQIQLEAVPAAASHQIMLSYMTEKQTGNNVTLPPPPPLPPPLPSSYQMTAAVDPKSSEERKQPKRAPVEEVAEVAEEEIKKHLTFSTGFV